MNKLLPILSFFVLLLLSPTALAQSDFCRGFEVGWKSIKGEMSLVPLCPLEPLTPLGSTPYREGILRGQEEARKRS